MIEWAPEIFKSVWGIITAGLIGTVGVAYKKCKKIDRDIQIRPTYKEVEKLLNKELELIDYKQSVIFDKLEEIHEDVKRLESVTITRNHREN